jgi:hypothetical protein
MGLSWRKWRVLLELLCALGAGCLFMQSLFRATRRLADLTEFTGQLAFASAQQGTSRTSYVVFTFSQPAATLGLDIGVGSREAQQLASQVHPGDRLVIHYDAAGTLLKQEVNLLAYQVQTAGGKMVYAITEVHRRYWYRALLAGAVGLLCASSVAAKIKK